MGQELQIIIRDWTVVGNDRIVGTVSTRSPGSPSRTIITSPVLHVRLMGTDEVPLAFTASGSMYWLGEPSDKYGLDRAKAFVALKAAGEQAPHRPPVEPEHRTTVMRF